LTEECVPLKYIESIIIPKYAPNKLEAPPVLMNAVFENILLGLNPSSLPLQAMILFIH
jgi:hypothetical protein